MYGALNCLLACKHNLQHAHDTYQLEGSEEEWIPVKVKLLMDRESEDEGVEVSVCVCVFVCLRFLNRTEKTHHQFGNVNKVTRLANSPPLQGSPLAPKPSA